MVLAGGLWYQWIEFNQSVAAVREAGIPFYGVVGNHEKYTLEWYIYDEDFSNYQTHFDYTEAIDEPGENELYYSFDYTGVHFIFLNTEDHFDDREEGSFKFNCSTDQINWLQTDLSNTNLHDFIVVSFHRTAWSIREDRPDRWLEAESIRDDFHDLFVQNDVDLVLMGHDHYYYHTIRDGIHYVTTGGGGAPLAGIDPDLPIWQTGDVAYSEHHYCHVEADEKQVTITALTPNGTTLDRFTINISVAHSPTNELYLIKEVVEATTDWTDVIWDDEVQVVATNYQVIEGENAILGMSVSGLNVWISKEGYDTTKVVLEVEAMILKNSESAQIRVEKGDIEYTKIQLYSYQDTEEYVRCEEINAVGPHPFLFTVDLSNIYSHSPGIAVVEDTVPSLKGKVYAFYYPWYGNSIGPSGESFHWEGVTNEDIFNSDNYPLLGPYDSHDSNVILTHIKMAKQAGIDGFIVSWWGQDTFEDRAMDIILDVAKEEDFSISIYYETVRDINLEDMIQELTYVTGSYCDHPAFLKENNEPVIFVYVPSYNGRDAEHWLSIREKVEGAYGPITLIGDHNQPDLLNAFEAFHTYIYLGDDPVTFFTISQERMAQCLGRLSADEAITHLKNASQLVIYNKPFLVTVCPGFDNTDWAIDGLYVDREEGRRYERNWQTAIDLNAHTILLTSWNEWHEGTELEPSREHGFEYMQKTKDFVEQYKGVQIPIQESHIETVLNPIIIQKPNEGSGSITFKERPGAPLIMTSIETIAVDDLEDIRLTGIFTSYYEEQSPMKDEVVIPYIGEDQQVDVSLNPQGDHPILYVNVKGFDPAGNEYQLFRGLLSVSGRMMEPIDNLEELQKEYDRLNEELTRYSKELQEELDELMDELNQKELQLKKWRLYTYGASGTSIIFLLIIVLLFRRRA